MAGAELFPRGACAPWAGAVPRRLQRTGGPWSPLCRLPSRGQGLWLHRLLRRWQELVSFSVRRGCWLRAAVPPQDRQSLPCSAKARCPEAPPVLLVVGPRECQPQSLGPWEEEREMPQGPKGSWPLGPSWSPGHAGQCACSSGPDVGRPQGADRLRPSSGCPGIWSLGFSLSTPLTSDFCLFI